MALTTINSRVALIVIDLQKGVVGLPVAHPMAEIVGRARQLADAFRRRGLPVVLVNVTGAPPGRTERGFRGELPEGFAEFVPELDRSRATTPSPSGRPALLPKPILKPG